MSRARWSLIGAGVGVAAGAVTTAGFAVDRLIRGRRTAVRLGTDVSRFEETPDTDRIVITDDGVALYAEVDEPRGTPPDVDGAPAPAPTVVLCHGYTHNLGVWVLQRRALREAGYRVVLWDLRGHGRSGEGGEDDYTIAQTGDDLGRIIDEVVPDGPVVLIGHSMGGMSIMSLAHRRPDLFGQKVIGVGLVATSSGELAGIDFGLGKRLGAAVHRIGPAAMMRIAGRPAVLETARGAGKDLEEYLVHRYSFATHVPLGVVRWVADMIFHTRMSVISAFFTHLTEYDELEALAALLGVETLVMHGSQDRIIPVAHAQVLVEAIPGCEYVEVHQAGHVLPLEYPDLVSRQLVGLVERARRSMASEE